MLSPPSRICSLTATRLMSGIAPEAPGFSSNRLKSEVPPPMSTIRTRRGSAVYLSTPSHRRSAAGCRSSQQ